MVSIAKGWEILSFFLVVVFISLESRHGGFLVSFGGTFLSSCLFGMRRQDMGGKWIVCVGVWVMVDLVST